MTGRIRIGTGDDVAPVRSVLARSSTKLFVAGQRGGEVVTQRPRSLPAEPLLAVRKSENQFVVDGLNVGRFLDQPPGDGFRYPPWRGGTSYSSRRRCPT